MHLCIAAGQEEQQSLHRCLTSFYFSFAPEMWNHIHQKSWRENINLKNRLMKEKRISRIAKERSIVVQYAEEPSSITRIWNSVIARNVMAIMNIVRIICLHMNMSNRISEEILFWSSVIRKYIKKIYLGRKFIKIWIKYHLLPKNN